jgi:DNA-binding response OmpR family regulator
MQLATTESTGPLTRFLPMMDQERSFVPQAIEESRKTGYRVLIFERSAPLAKLLATGLSAESLAVDVTHEPEEFVRRLDSRTYHLVILDMDTPNVDSMELLQGLRARKPDTRVLGLSGRSNIEDLVAALDHGADDYLFKPFSLLELMARVRALRRRSEAMTPPVPC